MAYVVDGNNVMGQTVGWHRDKAGARRRLLEDLAAFARAKKARLTVVFDGAPDDRMPEASAFRGVRVLYAARGSDADTRIEQLVEASPDRRGLTVVTSDRRLAVTVRARGAAVLRSGEFRRLMEQTVNDRPAPADGEHVESGSLNEWMRYFGVPPGEDESP